MKRIFAMTLAALALVAATASADGLKYHLYAGAQGAWLDNTPASMPADFEASGSGAIEMTPHLTAVADVDYGFSHSYLRGAGGLRATISDVNDPNLSAYVGIRYRGGSISQLGPNEWAPDVGVGYRPAPKTWPHFLIGADAGYGLTSKAPLLTVGFRWEVGAIR